MENVPVFGLVEFCDHTPRLKTTSEGRTQKRKGASRVQASMK